MARKKKPARSSRANSKGDKSITAAQGHDGVLRTNDIVVEQASASDAFADAMPYNSIKKLEYGYDNAVAPPPGATVDPGSSTLTASTTTEETETAKTGGAARLGTNATVAARDVRGFAVKFYTDEGNWDLVGNNMPVFFIQDAMKFPDLVHAVKPEPHHGMPQAASAHDTFWDFVSLMPESTHMLLWVMSDRAIPRSFRMMQGFGVHTFRLVNEQGQSVFCKFHWKPLQGTHSLVWDEAVKISGADPDFHRRDLWEAIESGEFPEWELGLQIFSEEQAEGFSFDVLDSTKIVPEELVPLLPVGRMVLNRNPDNFFAETEQVAFCTAHIIPGIDFSNDPLLAGRIHSYADTQITRLGGPNFHEIPINSPLASVQNNQREGMHRQALHRGRVAYEPNSLAGGCPFQTGTLGFVSFPEAIAEDKVRGKPEKFAEHYAQATLFFDSQAAVEKAHIAAAFRFELSKVGVPAIRERVLSSLVNVSRELAAEVATGLGMNDTARCRQEQTDAVQWMGQSAPHLGRRGPAYVVLVVFLRVSGKRTLSRMNAFDLVVTVALGSTLATVLLAKDVALAEGVLAFALLIGLQFAVTWSSVRALFQYALARKC